MTYPIVTLDWNNGGRVHHPGLEVNQQVVAVDLDASCGWCMATVVAKKDDTVWLHPTDKMNYWPGADE